MNLRRLLLVLLTLPGMFVLRLPAAPVAASPLRLHWLGLNQISPDTNAAQFMKIWQLPQTKTLVAQTLDKLSRWPGHGTTNEASTRLRPLLDDFIYSEFYLEVSSPSAARFTSGPTNSQLFLALRLSADRDRLWRTNLSVVSDRLQISRTGDWTLVGFDLNEPVAESKFARGLRSGSARGPWLELELAPSGLAAALGALEIPWFTNKLSSLPEVRLTVTGQNGQLHTHAVLDRVEPYHLDLPPWEIPTNLIHGPLTSFTAVRGFSGWLAALPVWQQLQLAPPPDQAFVWSHPTIPFQTYLAAPLPDASNQLARLAPRLVHDVNPWLAPNADGSISPSANPPGIFWNGANLINPFLIATDFNQHDYLLAGMYPPAAPVPALPPMRIREAMRTHPDLLFCADEQTGIRVQDGLWITQLFRIVFHKPQLPFKAPGTVWLKAIELQLDECTTTVVRASPRQLFLERDSTVGLSALELHLLADWLESPQFPRGLHTFLAPPDPN